MDWSKEINDTKNILEEEAKRKHISTKFKEKEPYHVHQQSNTYDCALYVIQHSKLLLGIDNVGFNQETINNYV